MRPGVIGLEPTAAGELATRLQLAAETLERMRDDLAGRIRHSTWVGHDADRVRAEWQTVHYGSLTATAHGLRDAEQRLRVEIREQEWASGSGGTHPPGGVVPGGSTERPDGWNLPPWLGDTFFPITGGIIGLTNGAIGIAEGKKWLDLNKLNQHYKNLDPDKMGWLDTMGQHATRGADIVKRLDGPLGWYGFYDDVTTVISGVREGNENGWSNRVTGEVALSGTGAVLFVAGGVALVAGAPVVAAGIGIAGAAVGIVAVSDDVTEGVGAAVTWTGRTAADATSFITDTMTDVFSGPLAPSTVGGAVVDVVGGAPAAIGGVVEDVTSWRPW